MSFSYNQKWLDKRLQFQDDAGQLKFFWQSNKKFQKSSKIFLFTFNFGTPIG